MHEMTIAVGLLDHVLAAARQHGAVRVETIAVQAGGARAVVPEALELAFAELAKGTPAEGATITLTETPVKARCRACGRAYRPARQSEFDCPGCGQADAEILEGNDILLVGMTALAPGEHTGGQDQT